MVTVITEKHRGWEVCVAVLGHQDRLRTCHTYIGACIYAWRAGRRHA